MTTTDTTKKTVQFGDQVLDVLYAVPSVSDYKMRIENFRMIDAKEYLQRACYSGSARTYISTRTFEQDGVQYMAQGIKFDLFGDGTGIGIGRLQKNTPYEYTQTTGRGKKKQTRTVTLSRWTDLGVAFFAIGCQHVWRAPKAGEWINAPYGRCVTNHICDTCGAKESIDSSD